MRVRKLAVAAAMMFMTTAAFAHDHATGVVKERMDMMEAMARNMKAIGNHIKAKANLADVKGLALAIGEHAGHIPMLFPPGSKQAPTEATDAVWQRPDDFAAMTRKLETAAKQLSEADPKNVDAMTARVRLVTEACSGCHDVYRRKQR
jgi:cytochrome c556